MKFFNLKKGFFKNNIKEFSKDKKWLVQAIKQKTINFRDYNSFSNITYIDEGASGKIYRVKWKDGDDVALKEFKGDDVIKRIVQEYKSHNKVHSHEDILSLHGITQDPKSGDYLLVLQFANHGTLDRYLIEKELDWGEKLRLAYQLARGIKILHMEGIVHRDLHAKNVLIVDHNIKISDFGLTKSRGNAYGNIKYTDPKCIKNRYPKTEKSDIFSLGVLLWQISSCRSPYESVKDEMDLYLNDLRESKVDGTPEGYFDLYTRCWDSDPDKRPDIKSIVECLDKLKQHYAPNIIKKTTIECLQNASSGHSHSSGLNHRVKLHSLIDNLEQQRKKQKMGSTSTSDSTCASCDQYINDSNTGDVAETTNDNSFNNNNDETYYNSSLHSITIANKDRKGNKINKTSVGTKITTNGLKGLDVIEL